MAKNNEYHGYWPNAIAYHGGKEAPVRLFSYEPIDTLERAKECIKMWHDHYKYDILVSWIEHSWDHKKVCFNVDEKIMRKLEFGGYFNE